MFGARQLVGLACSLSVALAAVLLCGVAQAEFGPVGAGADSAAPPPGPDASPAERDFYVGQQLFLAGRCAEALPYFQRSFVARPSPNSRLYVARCLVEIGELLAAHEEYKQLIIQVSEELEPEQYSETQRAATSERARLRNRLSWVRVSIPNAVKGSIVELAGQQLEPDDLHEYVYVTPGAVDIRATAPGYAPFTQRLYLDPGQLAEVVIVWPQALSTATPLASRAVSAPSTSPLLPLAVVSAGVGLAGVGTWAAFGLRAQARYDDLEARCSVGDCPRSEISQGKRETTVSHLGLGVGIAGVVGSAALWIAGQNEDEAPAALEVSLGLERVGVRGRF